MIRSTFSDKKQAEPSSYRIGICLLAMFFFFAMTAYLFDTLWRTAAETPTVWLEGLIFPNRLSTTSSESTLSSEALQLLLCPVGDVNSQR